MMGDGGHGKKYPLTNKIYDLAKAKIVILCPLPLGGEENGPERGDSLLPLWEKKRNRHLSAS